jgi:hypothetical protein
MRWAWAVFLSVLFSTIWVYLVADWIKPITYDLTLKMPNNDVVTNVWVPVLIFVGILVAAHRNSLLFLDDITPKARAVFIILTFGSCLLVSLILLLGPLGVLPTYETFVDASRIRVPAI